MKAQSKVEQLERKADEMALDEDLTIIVMYEDRLTGEIEEGYRVVIKANEINGKRTGKAPGA
jgi:hypothetical protein